jgi:hypothetical protein
MATPAVTPQASDENPFDAPLASEGGQAPSATAPDAGNPFDEPLESEKAGEGGPSEEEKQFLKENPDHEYLKQDPKFPNRPEGIYPKGPGNEWRKDPSYSQAPIDLHLAKHTLEGAAEGAVAAGSAPAAAAVGGTAAARAALGFATSEAGKDLIKLVLKHVGENLLTGAGAGLTYEAIHKAAKILKLDK